ncbi:MAG: VCBS repeat-containing protein [Planctomycetes bacterium]|nr:VCBS repeat-containing protein [Planctomycetota bacterium]
MPRRFVMLCGLCLSLLMSSLCSAGEIRWERIKIDGTFRSEGVAAADINKDGKIDVIAGDVWYEAPNWSMHAFRKVGEYHGDKGYSQSFANWTYDINGDGWEDIIVVGFPGEPFHWYENPKGNYDTHWTEHVIWHSACNESPDFLDLTGDGKPEAVLGSQPEAKLGFLPIPSGSKVREKWNFHAVSRAGNPRDNGTFKYYHGLGAGDVNNDGRSDVVIPHGWWEAPKNRQAGPWEFHPYRLSKEPNGNPLPAGDLHVDDLDLDGDQDIIMSSAHAFGIWWFENLSGNDASQFKYHLIDESYSQTHAMEFKDINGDGNRDIITGKRYFAHQGKDPGGKDPVVMYWYEVKKKKGSPPEFIPHEIKAGRDTGIGTQFLVTDINGDQLYDIVLSNKKGVNVLIQVR